MIGLAQTPSFSLGCACFGDKKSNARVIMKLAYFLPQQLPYAPV
jgi:hypothetical protein